jgi:hypothetical protein
MLPESVLQENFTSIDINDKERKRPDLNIKVKTLPEGKNNENHQAQDGLIICKRINLWIRLHMIPKCKIVASAP